jgi:hypothetical protein
MSQDSSQGKAAPAAKTNGSDSENKRGISELFDQRNLWRFLLPLFTLFGPISLVIYATDLHKWSVLGFGLGVGAAATLSGGLVGFLFGIPRSPDAAQGTSAKTGYLVNTNLEQISDWLTKILVGVGLVQLGRAPNALARLAHSLKPGFGGESSSSSFGLAIAIFLAISGFLYLYLWTRVYFSRDLQEREPSPTAVDPVVPATVPVVTAPVVVAPPAVPSIKH